MDLLQKQGKYKDYLKKLERARQDKEQLPGSNQALHKSDIILEQLRKKEDVSESNVILWILVILVGFIVLASNVKFGNWLRLIPLFIMICFLIVYRIQIVEITKIATKLKVKHNQTAQNSTHNYLQIKIEYIINGLNIKLKRAYLIQWFYVLFFPILMLYILEFIKSHWPFGSFIQSIALAYLIGGIGWLFIFRPYLRDLKKIKADLKSELESITS